VWHTCCGAGQAWLWMTNGHLTYSVHVIVQPPLQDQCSNGYVIQYQASGYACTPYVLTCPRTSRPRTHAS
jgi:hypothetical protein